jgi:flavodoxin
MKKNTLFVEESKHLGNILIAYFSHSGNTRIIANQIHDIVSSDIFEILSVEPYTRDYNQCVDQARRELREKSRPALQNHIENMENYNVIFLGYPNWWGTIPMPVATFLSEYDFSGKTLIPFCTNEGSRMGRSETDIRASCPQSKFLEGFPIRGSSVNKAQKDVAEWLKKIGYLN